MTISSIVIANELLNKNKKFFTLKNMLLAIPIISVTCLMYSSVYTSILTILVYITMIITFKIMFDTNFPSAIIVSTIIMLLTALVDVAVTSVNSLFLTFEQMRSIWYVTLINNTLVCTVSILISKIPFIAKPIKYLCSKTKNKKIEQIFFGTTVFIVMTMFYYNITTIFELNTAYIITLVCMGIFFLLFYFYTNNKNEHDKLNDEYNNLLESVETFEEWIDNEQLYRHELKNTLSLIRGMTKNKKIIAKLDEILEMSIILDEEYIENLKHVPKSNLKSLLYYKIALARKSKINITVEVSSNITKIIQNLTDDEMKKICMIIGIYFDNAIEAALQTNKKILSIEMYSIDNNLNIVVSNSCKNILSIKNMSKKKYSTKGKGRGKGLYYASKIINKNKWLNSTSNFLNGYFIQKLIITQKKEAKLLHKD